MLYPSDKHFLEYETYHQILAWYNQVQPTTAIVRIERTIVDEVNPKDIQ
jgi:hypothetical protein